MADPAPPHVAEAEEALLAVILQHPAGLRAATTAGVTAGSYYSLERRTIHAAAQAVATTGAQPDLITVTTYLAEHGQLKAAGGRPYVATLATGHGLATNAAHYATTVAAAAEQRGMQDTLFTALEHARNGGLTPQQRATLAQQLAPRGHQPGEYQYQPAAAGEFIRSVGDDTGLTFCVADHIPAGALCVLGASPKAGKTWVGVDMGLATSTGTPFAGHYPTTSATILYVALEGAAVGLATRLSVLARGRGLDPGRQIDEFRTLYKPRGGLDLLDTSCVRALAAACQADTAEICFIDVLRNAAPGLEETGRGAQQFGQIRENLRYITDDLNCAVVLLHHFTKPPTPSRGQSTGEALAAADRLAGSGAIRGAYDVGLFLSAIPNVRDQYTLEVEARDYAPPPRTHLQLKGEPTGKNGTYRRGDTAILEAVPDADAAATRQSTHEEQLYQWITLNPGRSQRVIIEAHPGGNEHDLRAALTALADQGRVTRARQGRGYAHYAADQAPQPIADPGADLPY